MKRRTNWVSNQVRAGFDRSIDKQLIQETAGSGSGGGPGGGLTTAEVQVLIGSGVSMHNNANNAHSSIITPIQNTVSAINGMTATLVTKGYTHDAAISSIETDVTNLQVVSASHITAAQSQAYTNAEIAIHEADLGAHPSIQGALVTHASFNEAHPDIREKLIDIQAEVNALIEHDLGGMVTQSAIDNSIALHETDPSAHPALHTTIATVEADLLNRPTNASVSSDIVSAINNHNTMVSTTIHTDMKTRLTNIENALMNATGDADLDAAIAQHNLSTSSHQDIRDEIMTRATRTDINDVISMHDESHSAHPYLQQELQDRATHTQVTTEINTSISSAITVHDHDNDAHPHMLDNYATHDYVSTGIQGVIQAHDTLVTAHQSIRELIESLTNRISDLEAAPPGSQETFALVPSTSSVSTVAFVDPMSQLSETTITYYMSFGQNRPCFVRIVGDLEPDPVSNPSEEYAMLYVSYLVGSSWYPRINERILGTLPLGPFSDATELSTPWQLAWPNDRIRVYNRTRAEIQLQYCPFNRIVIVPF